MKIKKIIFIIPNYDYGGTITSLRCLLPLISNENLKIYIFAINPMGNAYEELSGYAELVGFKKSKSDNYQGVFNTKQFFKLISSWIRTVKKSLQRCGFDISSLIFRRIGQRLSSYGFDLVIAFQEGQATILGSYIKSRNRIAWQHSMYSWYKTVHPFKNYSSYLSNYEKIVCVSKTAAADFISVDPILKPKIRIVHNALDREKIFQKARVVIDSFDSVFNIVSVGRITPVKRFSEIPRIARQISNKGIKIRWRIIGGVADNQEYHLLRDNILQYGVSNIVTIEGKKENPYPYIYKSDLYVCLSFSETFNYTIAESKLLNVPVVSTNFPSAYEFINNEVDGLICDINEIDSKIVELLCDPQKYNKMKNNLQTCVDYRDIAQSEFESLLKEDMNY